MTFSFSFEDIKLLSPLKVRRKKSNALRKESINRYLLDHLKKYLSNAKPTNSNHACLLPAALRPIYRKLTMKQIFYIPYTVSIFVSIFIHDSKRYLS